MATNTIIIGGGMAGLNCARVLYAAGHECVLLEASDRCGGRVRTERIESDDGTYLVDRGFQVLLTAYPHAAEAFDYDALDLRSFYPGALVFHDGELHRVADPRRKPGDALRGFRTPVATMRDKLRLAEFSLRVLAGSVDSIWERPNRRSIDALREAGFHQTTIDRFFRPFFGGVFFDPALDTSSRMLEFVFRMFAQGRTCVPAGGMGRLPEQIESGLPADAIRTGTRVERLERTGANWTVHAAADRWEARSVVIATEGDATERLLEGHADVEAPAVSWQSTATISYAVQEPPTDDPILVLDGEGEGPVNHLATMSAVAPEYAPPGRHLVYANVIDPEILASHSDDAALDAACRPQLERWFGEKMDGARIIHVDRIDRALPNQSTDRAATPQWPVRVGDGLYACGDWLENASIDGALSSGKRCAEAILSDTPA
ncbi:MAG: NAD(P)/FAD-dependent oxidoreductase [Phycisphaerales bacterium]|jgi:phytoene dehydrogenase-like protein